jgi:hypothetical protein
MPSSIEQDAAQGKGPSRPFLSYGIDFFEELREYSNSPRELMAPNCDTLIRHRLFGAGEVHAYHQPDMGATCAP